MAPSDLGEAFAGRARKLLSDEARSSALTEVELISLAFFLSEYQLPIVSALQAARILARAGYDVAAEPARLAKRLCRAAQRSREFQVTTGEIIVDLDRSETERRARSLLQGVRSGGAPSRRSAPPAPKPASGRPAKAAEPSSAPAAAPPATPTVPPPPPLVETQPSVEPLDPSSFAAVLARTDGDLATVSLALRAHALASAQQFQEILSLSSMRGVVPHAYQLETVRRVIRVLRGRALLADEVGLGKTIEAIITLREYQMRGMVRRVLVLVPPALVGQWAGELLVKASIEARTTEDPLSRESPEAFWDSPGVVVASIATARASKHAKAVAAAPWDLVVVDEAHHIKNRQTLAWKLVNELKSRFLLLLTATPVETDLEEIYNLVTLLRPGQLTTPAAFRAQFVDPKDPTSPRNHEQLRRLLSEVMVRNTRAQCGLGLPPRFVTTVAIEPSASERALYEDVVELLRAHAPDRGLRLLVSTLMLQAGSSARAVGATLERALSGDKHRPLRASFERVLSRAKEGDVDSGKAQRLVEIVRAQAGSVLVFTRYRETLGQVIDALEEAGLEAVPFHGGQSSAAKEEALSRFRSGARVMVATDVGAEGQNLQFCHVVVNYDLPWNPMVLEQRIGRLHRMGQTEEVLAFNLCARGTLEERVLDVLDRRLHLFELVVGEMDMVLGNLADERDLEERILELCASSRSEDELARGFDVIADELSLARTQYERARTLDETLFRRDFET